MDQGQNKIIAIKQKEFKNSINIYLLGDRQIKLMEIEPH